MKNAETLTVLKANHRVIGINLKDLTHEESLISPANGGSSINWILGHIIVSRDGMAEILGIDRISDDNLINLYKRGTQNISDDNAVKLETLLNLFNNSQAKIEEKASNTDFSNDVEKLKSLTFLAFHEAYHCGQTGLLRRIIGKEGAIK